MSLINVCWIFLEYEVYHFHKRMYEKDKMQMVLQSLLYADFMLRTQIKDT